MKAFLTFHRVSHEKKKSAFNKRTTKQHEASCASKFNLDFLSPPIFVPTKPTPQEQKVAFLHLRLQLFPQIHQLRGAFLRWKHPAGGEGMIQVVTPSMLCLRLGFMAQVYAQLALVKLPQNVKAILFLWSLNERFLVNFNCSSQH